MNPKLMTTYANVGGWALAESHARTGDAIAIASYLGSSDVLDRAPSAFAASYAGPSDLDYQVLKTAVASGRVKAEMGSDSGLLARAEGMETLSGDVRDRSENLRNELLGGPDTGVGLQRFVEKRPL